MLYHPVYVAAAWSAHRHACFHTPLSAASAVCMHAHGPSLTTLADAANHPSLDELVAAAPKCKGPTVFHGTVGGSKLNPIVNHSTH